MGSQITVHKMQANVLVDSNEFVFIPSVTESTLQSTYNTTNYYCCCSYYYYYYTTPYHNHFTALFRDHPGEPVPDENFWTLWRKGRLTEADTPTLRLGATLPGLSSAHLHHPQFFKGRMPFLLPNKQCQSTECN